MKNNLILLLFFLFSTLVAGIKSPSYETLRARTMGNAFVALANGRDALNYNIAGLNRSKDRYDNSLDLSFEMQLADFGTIGSFLGVGAISNAHGNFLKKYFSDFAGVLDNGLLSRSEFNKDLASIDRKPFIIRSGEEIGFAIQNFGVSLWNTNRSYSYIDQGIIIPQFGLFYFESDIAAQIGIAWSLRKSFSIGIGLRFIQRYSIEDINISIIDIKDSLFNQIKKKPKKSMGVGFDVGGLWDITSELVVGASYQNLLLTLNKFVVPELTVGVNYCPKILQARKSMLFARTFHITADYENIFSDQGGLFHHTNIGVELSQEILGPLLVTRFAGGLNNNFNYTAGLGFDIFSFIELDYGTWTENLNIINEDYQRIHTLQLTLGF